MTEAHFKTMCEDKVISALKLPSSATFPSMMEDAENHAAVTDTDLTWSSWVEAENSLGGRVRLNYGCIYDRKTDTLRVFETKN